MKVAQLMKEGSVVRTNFAAILAQPSVHLSNLNSYLIALLAICSKKKNKHLVTVEIWEPCTGQVDSVCGHVRYQLMEDKYTKNVLLDVTLR